MKLSKGILLFSLSVALIIPGLFVQKADAVPSFAREYGVGCSSCHDNWPRLSKFGRDFQENGFKMDSDDLENVSDYLSLNKTFPISARFNMRILDKNLESGISGKKKQLRMRSMHEVEIFFAGNASKHLSFFAELEAEDEWPDPATRQDDADAAPGFQVQLAVGYMTYHFSDMLKTTFGFGSPFAEDAYNTVHSHKNTRHEWAVASKGFLPGGESQFVSLSGRPMDQLFYIVAWSANSGRLEGDDPQNLSGRLAYDVNNSIMVGGFLQAGKEHDGQISTRDFSRYGLDFQGELGSLALNAIYAMNKDVDRDGIDDSAFSLELQHFMRDSDDFLSASCKLTLSSYTKNNGDDKYIEAGLFFTKFATDNLKVQIGWEGELDSPDEHNAGRATFVVDLGF